MSPHLLSRLARRAFFIALVAAPARAQEPAPADLAADPRLREIQQALLAGDVERARANIVSLESSASPAELRELKPAVDLLAAATSAPLARPDGMLAVAEKWPGRREGQVALVAGLAAWIALRDEEHDLFAPLLPSCSQREISIDAKELAVFDSGSDARRGAFRRALEQIERRHEADGDLKRRAQILFADLETSTLEPIRLRSSQAPLLPRPRLEPVRIRIDRLPKLGTDLVDWFTRDHADPPALDRLLELEQGDDALPPLAPGIYGVELRSTASGWTGMRELLVSDLDLLVDTRGGACVVLALLNGRAQPGVEVTFDDDGAGRVAPETGRTGPDGTLLLRFYGGRSRIVARCAAERGEQVAVFRWSCRCEVDAPGSSRDSLLVHWMVDAPLHRRGETVRGRVVAHNFEERPLETPDGTLDAEQIARPLANEPLVLRFWPGSPTERTVRGRSDADGLLAFELPLDDDAPLGPVPVRVDHDGDCCEASSGSSQWYDRWNAPFSVEAVKRPPLLLEVGWPPPFARCAPRPVVRVAARLPSGAPAGELAGTLSLSLGSFSEKHDFRLDPGGEASLPIACDTLPAAVFSWRDPGQLHLSITSPDGQVVEESGSLRLVEPATDPEPSTSAEDEESLRFVSQSDPARAGDEVEFELAGRKLETLLVTAGRAEIWWHRSVRLNESGRARISIQTRREWRPGFYVRAASLRRADRSIDQQTTWLSLPRPGGEVRAELDEHDAHFAPGTHTTLHVTTRDEEGRPVAALVSVAIVDESLYLLSEDRTMAPWQRLLPSPRIDRGDVDCTPDADDALAVLGPMFELGRMRKAGSRGLGGGGDTTPGLGGGGPSTSLSLRDDLRPIAAFIPRLKTGAGGRASFPVDLPDDLTRWRVTLVSVCDDGHGEITKSSLTTVRDPSILILAPRFLRSGDELEIPAVANASDGPPRSVVLRADASPDYSLPGARELSELAELLTPGTPITKSWRLRGDAEVAGHAWFAIDLLDTATGTRLDGERRELPIVSRTIERPCAATAIVCGGAAPPIDVVPPTLADALSSRVTVELLGDRTALLDSASRWLEGYPYGCAEQTLSRLVPLFAAARARNLALPPGAPQRQPILRSEQARRFESGMARLRDMKSSDGYAWWPGGHADAFMTPLILTGLALAREAGLDPDAYRAVADLSHGAIRACVTELAKADGDPRVAEESAQVSNWLSHQHVTEEQGAQLVAEMAVAVLRLLPADREAREAVEKLIATDAPLSSNLLFRAGLALVRSGNREAAARAFERATGDDVNPPCVVPLEAAPEALASERLELARALGRPRAELDAVEGELLGLFNDNRFGTTWTTALALCALADDGTPSAAVASDSNLVVRAGGREQIVRLDDSNRRHALLELGDVPKVELSSVLPTHVVAVVTRRHAFDGVTCRGWSEPLHVERRVWKSSATSTSDEDGALESMADGSVRCHVGDVLEIDLSVTGPADLTYFAVTCPLPAGCELVGRGDDFEQTGGTAEDARLIWAFRDQDELGWRHARARIVAAHAGVVGWPAAQAEAMYRPASSGAGSGSRLVIEPVVERPRDEALTWLTRKARAVRRDELVGEAMMHAESRRARYEPLWDLRRFPDEVADALFQRLDPSIVEWDDDVGTLLEVLGDRRAALLDGSSLSQLVAKAGWHDVPMSCASLEAWAVAVADCHEGHALIDRWLRADPRDDSRLGPIERRIAGASVIAGHWRREPIDPVVALRSLRAEEFAGDETLAEVVRAEREQLLAWTSIESDLDSACRAIVERDGVRTRPRDPAAFAPLARWEALLAYVRGELDRDEPAAESCRLAGRLIEWKVPELLGAAPFPEERAIESSIASLRTSLMSALVRLLEHGDLGRFGGDVPGRGILQSLDRAAAESWLLASIDAADRGSGCLGVEFVVDRLDEYADRAALDSPLGGRLVEIADHGPPEWCAPALKAFPVAERARLPIALLTTRRSVYSDPEGPPDPAAWLLEPFRVDALAESAAGRATVVAAIRAWNGDDDGRADSLARVVVKCPAAEFAALPDVLLLELFPELNEEARGCVRSEFVRRARGSRAAAEAFADRLAQPQDRRTRELLVEAVAAADGVEVIWDGNDPAADRYRALLAARRGDADALDELRRSIRITHGGRDREEALPSDELLVAEQTLLTHGTADDLDSGLFVEVDRAARLARFGRFGREPYERERTIDWPRELIERGVALR